MDDQFHRFSEAAPATRDPATRTILAVLVWAFLLLGVLGVGSIWVKREAPDIASTPIDDAHPNE